MENRAKYEIVENMQKGDDEMAEKFDRCFNCGKGLKKNPQGDTDSIYLELDAIDADYMQEFCSLKCLKESVKKNQEQIKHFPKNDLFILFSASHRDSFIELLTKD
jgi:hypothetical protein